VYDLRCKFNVRSTQVALYPGLRAQSSCSSAVIRVLVPHSTAREPGRAPTVFLRQCPLLGRHCTFVPGTPFWQRISHRPREETPLDCSHKLSSSLLFCRRRVFGAPRCLKLDCRHVGICRTWRLRQRRTVDPTLPDVESTGTAIAVDHALRSGFYMAYRPRSRNSATGRSDGVTVAHLPTRSTWTFPGSPPSRAETTGAAC
jgi:hypothetical protein